MGRISNRDLRLKGVPPEDIATARTIQEAQRRTGAKVQSIAVIVGAAEPRRPSSPASRPVDLTEHALRKRGTYDQAALLLDQQALQEQTPERAERARAAAQTAKDLSATTQLEFDFFGGNVSIAFQYQDAVTERLFEAAKTTAQAKEALSILWTITRHLGWQTYECSKTAADLCEITRTDKGDMARALKLLEDTGAIQRVKKGRTKVIAVTPEGAFRGKVENHGKAVERFRLDVIEGGKTDA
ncbi:winged helix DNA-binding protein [Aureimonas ureilytica]|uniref:winged helix DNA-binding protein n=1 Tax=Aureimonas ureilytica TaxID=401562 RepID=UPI000761B6CD|nr:winged helix DNA-binding protein [Aureimonas ureilytica]